MERGKKRRGTMRENFFPFSMKKRRKVRAMFVGKEDSLWDEKSVNLVCVYVSVTQVQKLGGKLLMQ